MAPIGEKIFSFIVEQNSNINFELVKLDTTNVDGMLYIPESGNEKAYIILNGNKPLVNQIFAAAHEYYHYIKDYESIKKKNLISAAYHHCLILMKKKPADLQRNFHCQMKL